MVPFAWGLDWRAGGWCASFALPGIRGGDAAVDVDYVSGRFGRARAHEERDRLGDVFGEHGDAELRPALVEGLELVLADAVRARAFGLPVGRPDARALDHGVGVDGVDANPVRSAFLGQAAGEVERGRLRGGVRGGVRSRDEGVLRRDEDDGPTASLVEQHAERLAC